ncbi:DUF982 domain-containing protein [Rhizobium sp. P38BS-XIX]|uniref:DUF982 domain-containing protein n=1 Tax=Rhizobium sp. P38BS-XIX TaxID=2726740 RepID=UPI0014565437|nr:DUF982 domain-containing protein [Rhizobium sp. P38BS-XIX]NLR97310.1 DUF982 domain-containing protein [Rhizobium sp. P38BS-XIX]
MTWAWWTKPVTVEATRPGRRVMIISLARAEEYMSYEWPKAKNGAAFEAAELALQDARSGKLNPEQARDAFVAALEEAGIQMF